MICLKIVNAPLHHSVIGFNPHNGLPGTAPYVCVGRSHLQNSRIGQEVLLKDGYFFYHILIG